MSVSGGVKGSGLALGVDQSGAGHRGEVGFPSGRIFGIHYSYSSLNFKTVLNMMRMEQEGISKLVSYDRDFDKLGWVTRVKPEDKEGYRVTWGSDQWSPRPSPSTG